MIETIIGEIQGIALYRLNTEQLSMIKEVIANYGLACCMDSEIRREAKEICLRKDNLC